MVDLAGQLDPENIPWEKLLMYVCYKCIYKALLKTTTFL